MEASLDPRTRRPPGPLARARAVTRDPLSTAVRWHARRDATALVQRHARLARRAGIDRVYLLLSFDCDTADDAAVVSRVHDRLAELGVRPSYAVPGALLQQASEVYARIADAGAEFLNHGGVEHTYFDSELGRHASCFFYDRLERPRVTEDVEEGHRIVREVIGRRAEGFRTPHFGTYQQRDQLHHLHTVLRGLDYRFSTSTTPRFGLRYGPVSMRFGLPELPVTGVPKAPFEIMDTWGFFAAPDRTRTPADYVDQAQLLAEELAKQGAGLVNIYGDPVHIHDSEEFFQAIAALVEVAEPISYGALLDRVGL